MNQQLLVETQQRTDKMQRDDGYVADGEEGLLLNEEGSRGFVIGSGTSPVRDRGSRSRNSHSSRSSWVRRNQNRRMSSQVGPERSQHSRGEGSMKRKANEESEVLSKLAKQVKGSMVPQKPSNPQ